MAIIEKKIRKVKIPPDEGVIKALEKLLEEAKNGDIQCMAYAISYSDAFTTNGWCGMNKNNTAMLGELNVLAADLTNCIIGNNR